MPTGDPTIPFTVCEAKAIRVLIIEKAEGGTGSGEEGFAAEDGDVANPDDDGVDEEVGGQNEADLLVGNEGSVAGNSRGNLVSNPLPTIFFCPCMPCFLMCLQSVTPITYPRGCCRCRGM